MFLAFISVLLALTGCDTGLPRDPENTFNRVQGNKLRLGIVSNSPWAYIEEGEPHGVEYELVQQLADRLDSEIVWRHGSETEIMSALQAYQLDLAIGGFISGPHAPSHVAVTLSYYPEQVIIATDEATDLSSLDNEEIYVEFGSVYIRWLREHGAVVQTVETLSPDTVPVVIAEYQAEAWDLQVTEYEVATHEHIMVVPPGENGWLVYVEEFLFKLNPEDVTRRLMGEA